MRRCVTHDLGSYAQGQGSDQRSKSCLSNNSKTTEANLTKLHRKIEHYDMVFHAQELGSYAQGQGSLAVFKVTARDQGHYKGPSGAFVTYCNISCFTVLTWQNLLLFSQTFGKQTPVNF